MSFLLALDLGLALIALVVLKKLLAKPSTAPLPPGPKGFPFLGLLALPHHQEWMTFAQWGEKYGDICSVSVLGRRVIIVNKAKIAIDMLEKKGSIYSDRPILHMGGELCGWAKTVALIPYNDHFRNLRKLAQKLFGNHATMKPFMGLQEIETHRYLKRLLKNPDDFSAHIRKTAGAIILRIGYGYQVADGEDPFVALADRATDQFSASTAPGGFLVNTFPSLRHIPSWMPGATFKRLAKTWEATLEEMATKPIMHVKEQMAEGTAEPSFVSRLLEDRVLTPKEEYDVKWTAVSFYAGGSDTTVSAVHGFVKAMVMFPEVQAQAQAEIDAVVGNDRLPDFSDKDHLPYINALVLEVTRWHTTAPIAIPHRVTADDIHEGYFIPKGSLVIPNVWQMMHDPEIYPDPMRFDPSRFLKSEGRIPQPDPREAAFGFGRRLCPGKVLAESSVFMSCLMTLAVFNIGKRCEGGVLLEPRMEQMDGTISHPSPFQCTITPRSAKAIALIEADERE